MTGVDRGAEEYEGRAAGTARPGVDRTLADGIPAVPAFVPRETKLHPPRRQAQLVPRARLNDSLRERPAPLVVFSAPAGSGKTLTVRQWLDAEKRPFAWLQLDRGDNDPATLLQYVARSLMKVMQLDPAVTAWLELPHPPIEKVIAPTLATAVSSAPPFVLVLDDCHLVGESRCWALLASLVEALPTGSTMVVCGRADPPLPLARLRAQQALAEYGIEKLAFDRDEVRQLLDLHGVAADDDAISALLTATEGWATGVYLAVLASRRNEWRLADVPVTGDLREIADYLTSEVLGGQDAETARFLTRTSIVWRLCGELCDALTGREDGAAVLEAIDRHNLFVMRVEGMDGWYRYHHLFAELLQTELHRREPLLVPELHRRAARWSADKDRVQDAVQHWLAAGDVEAAGDLVAARWLSRYLTGRLGVARRWIDAFAPAQIRSHKALAIAATWVGALTGDSVTARGLLSTLDGDEASTPSPDGAVSIGSSVAILRSILAPDGPFRMREDARLAVSLEEADRNGVWHGFACWLLGVAEMLCDCDTVAERVLREVAVTQRARGNGIALAALGQLSLIAGDAERWQDAERLATDAARAASSYEVEGHLHGAPARMARDRLLAREGDEDAVADLEELAGELDPDFCPWLCTQATLLLAEAALDRADGLTARDWLDDAREGLVRCADAPGLARRVVGLEELLRSRSAVEPVSRAETGVLELLPTNLTVREIAGHLGVSPNTVGSHMKSLYRKLGVRRRSQAVDRAVTLGLLRARPPAG